MSDVKPFILALAGVLMERLAEQEPPPAWYPTTDDKLDELQQVIIDELKGAIEDRWREVVEAQSKC